MGADTRLVMWIFAWGSHALRTAPMQFFDANAFYPASRIITGSEPFAGVQGDGDFC